ncbi:MAG TPA: glycosyltransferase family 2 protein [Thermodesulfobacteriota bacterium]|nr:glycosyltransferase family 2 protein [Thermodesulfobacteriota bacterium]
MDQLLFSLIIPTYNERQNIIPLVQRVTLVLSKITDDFEIIVVDDDSPDKTWELVEDLSKKNPYLRVIRRFEEKGLAKSVVQGWEEARGEILGVMDGDLQHPPEVLPALISSILDTDADIAVASRNVTGGGVSDWSLVRRFISWGGACIATFMLPGILKMVRDPMSGYFLIKRSVVQSVNLKPEGYKILLEVLAKGEYQTIIEVPYTFEERKEGGSKLGPVQYLQFFTHMFRLAMETGQVGRFLRFCTVGLSGVFVNEGALKFFTEVSHLYYVYSSILAVEIAIISNFVLNEFWTFRDRSRLRPGMVSRLGRLVRFNLICGVGGILNVVTLWALTDLAGLYYLYSNLIGIGISTIWNYGLNSNITWEPRVTHRLGKISYRGEVELKKYVPEPGIGETEK